MKRILFVLILAIVFACTAWYRYGLYNGQKKIDPLYELANEKLQHMIATDQFNDHNIDGCDFICRQERNNVVDSWTGENLYRNKLYLVVKTNDGEKLVNNPEACDLAYAHKLWMGSPTHRANLEHEYDRSLILIGKSQSYCYMVQVFSIN